MEATSSSPPPKKQRRRRNSLSEMNCLRREGVKIDFNLVVRRNGERKKIGIHAIVLGAKSEVFNTIFLEGKGTTTLELPDFINLETADTFVELLYENEDVEPKSIDWKVLLDILQLGRKYSIQALEEDCEAALIAKMDKANVGKLYEVVGSWNGNSSKLKSAASTFILSRLAEFVGPQSEEQTTIESNEWPVIVWKMVLAHEEIQTKSISEWDLFNALMRWRDFDDKTREPHFTELLLQIRFPLMSPETIIMKVEPTGSLTDSEIVDILSQMSNGHRVSSFSTESRNKRVARNGDELRAILASDTPPGEVIQLLPTKYVGPFTVSNHNDKITLKGCGPQTILVSPTPSSPSKPMPPILLLDSEESTLSGLSFSVPTGQRLSRDWRALVLTGAVNKVQNISFENCSMKVSSVRDSISNVNINGGYGIMLDQEARHVEISNVKMKNVRRGISCDGSFNKVRQAKIVNGGRPICIGGERNEVSDISCTYDDKIDFNTKKIFFGMVNFRSKMGKVKNLRYTIPETSDDNIKKYGLYFTEESEGNVVENCGIGPVFLCGNSNKLINVNCGKFLEVDSQKGCHSLKNCVGNQLIKHGDGSNVKTELDMEDCNFFMHVKI